MKHPFLISFSGMDGSGKTQLIVLLRRFFRRQGIHYLYIHNTRDSFANRIAKRIPSFKNLIKPKVVSNDQPTEKRKLSTFSLAVRIITSILDALYLRFRLTYAWGSYDVIIFDRYIYDRLVQIAYLKQKNTVDFISTIAKAFPRPNLPLYLHITPEQSLKRKKEVVLEGQTTEYFETKYQLFEEGKILWKLLTLDNSVLSLSESKKKMISMFKKRYYRKFKREA